MIRLYSFLCSCLRTSYKGSRSKQNVNILPQGPKSQFFPQLPSSFTRNVSICFLHRIPVVDTTMLTSIFPFFMGAQLIYLGGGGIGFQTMQTYDFPCDTALFGFPQKTKPATAGGEDGGVQLLAHTIFVAGFVGESGRKSWSFGCLWLIFLGWKWSDPVFILFSKTRFVVGI